MLERNPSPMQKRVERFFRSIYVRPRSVILLSIAVLIFFSVALTKLKVDNSMEIWFVEADPVLTSYHEFLEDFGNDEWVVTLFTTAKAELSTKRLEKLHRVQEAVAKIDGVERVRTLANFPVITTGDLSSRTVVDGEVGDDDVARAQQALAQQGLVHRFIGKSASTLVMYTWLAARPDIDQQRPRILDELRDAVHANFGDSEEVNHVGMGLLYDEINRSTLGEGGLFIGLSYVVIIGILSFLFRSWRWTLFAIVVVTLADVALFGMMVLVGRPLHMFTMALPSVVMLIAVAHVMHLHAHLNEMPKSERETPNQILTAIAAVALPCILNGLTTSLGFGSLINSQIAITRDFGGFAAIGVLAGLLFAFVGAALILPRMRDSVIAVRPVRVGLFLERLVLFVLRRAKIVVGGSLVVVVVAAYFTSLIVVDTYSLGFLADEHPLRQDSALVEQRTGPYLPLEIVIEVKEPGAWKNPDIMHGLVTAQSELERIKDFGSTYSIADVLGETRRNLAGDPNLTARIDGKESNLTAQLLEIARANENQSDIHWLVSKDERRVRLTITVPMTSALRLREHGEKAMAIARAQIPSSATLSFGGYLPLNWTLVSRLVQDQVQSFLIAFLLVFSVVAIALRSWRLLIAAVVANCIPVLLTFGVMGAFGIRLDIATVTIAAAVLGIVVDDTIHILWAIRRELSEERDIEQTLLAAYRVSGSAIARTSLVFTLGFLVIAVSDVNSVAAVGGLTAVAVAAAFLTDICLLPVLVKWMYRR